MTQLHPMNELTRKVGDQQLIVDSTDYTGNTGVLPAEGSDEDVNINWVEDEPAFLWDQTKLSKCHSPVKIIKVSGHFKTVAIFSTIGKLSKQVKFLHVCINDC